MDLSNPYSMMHEIEANIEVILLLVFMVAGIFFMKNLMLTIFTKLLLNVKSIVWLSLLYCFTAAFLSAFLDALTVTAVLIGVTNPVIPGPFWAITIDIFPVALV